MARFTVAAMVSGAAKAEAAESAGAVRGGASALVSRSVLALAVAHSIFRLC